MAEALTRFVDPDAAASPKAFIDPDQSAPSQKFVDPDQGKKSEQEPGFLEQQFGSKSWSDRYRYLVQKPMAEAESQTSRLGANVIGAVNRGGDYLTNQFGGGQLSTSPESGFGNAERFLRKRQEDQASYAKSLGEPDAVTGMLGDVVSGVAQSPAYIGAALTAGPVAGPAIIGGLSRADEGASGAVKGALEGGLMGTSAKALNPYKLAARAAGTGATQAGITASEGGSKEDVTKSFGTGLAFGLAPGSGENRNLTKDVALVTGKAATKLGEISAQAESRGIVRQNNADFVLAQERAQHNLQQYSNVVKTLSVEQRLQFDDIMNTSGTKASGFASLPKELRPMAEALTKEREQRVEQIQKLGTGALQHAYEDYLAHFWTEPDAARQVFSKRSLSGPTGFLKQRTYMSLREGMDAGLKPLTTDPIEATLIKVREMDRFIMGQKIAADMKDAGWAKFGRNPKDAPRGWKELNDKVFRVAQYSEEEGGFISRGKYYAPMEVARDIDNFLSPGLKDHSRKMISVPYNALRVTGNMMNLAQLSLSAFHVGFTTMDAMISQTALGIKQIAEGRPIKGITNVALGVSPTAPITNFILGSKLYKAGQRGTGDPALQKIVDALTAGGGRIKMDDFYKSANVREFREAFQAIKRREGKLSDYGKVLRQALPLAADMVNSPIFQHLVPRQKLGVFYRMAQYEMEKNPAMTPTQMRDVMGKAWDSVDNRMGEMVYDNLFWNRVAKDIAMISMRSVGWNVGTIRELVGGLQDVGKVAKGELSHRLSYVIALPMVTALYGAMLNYLFTGSRPKELKDYYFPNDGRGGRLSLPTYMKDVYEYGHDFPASTIQTLKNKASPEVSMMLQMLNNEDFYGAAIIDPNDARYSDNEAKKIMQETADEVLFMMRTMKPFSLTSYQKRQKESGAPSSVSGYFASPSFIGITQAPGYITKSAADQDAQASSFRRNAVRKKMKREAANE